MRICFLSMEYPPYPSYISPGGVGTHVTCLTKSLAERGHEVHVIACGDSFMTDEVNGVYVHRIRSLPTSFFRVPVYSIIASIKLRRLFKVTTFDFIHNQSPYGFFEAYLLALTQSHKLLTTVHAVPVSENAKRERVHGSTLKDVRQTLALLIPQILFNKIEYFQSMKIITVSAANKQDLIKLHHVESAKVSVIYNGVDHNRFSPTVSGKLVRERLALGDSKVVLYVGRLERNKGINSLLEAALALSKKGIKPVFVIGGVGSFKSLVQRIQLKANCRIILTGRIPQELLPNYYAMADIVVVPSLYEGGPPLTLLEALSSGKPVITSNVPPINELIDNSCSVMINPGDIEGLVSNIEILLKSPEIRQRLGQAARQKVLDYFTWDRTAQQTEAVYSELLACK